MRQYAMNAKGIGYLEVILATVVLGLIVPSVFAWILQGVKMQEQIKSTHQVTIQAQNMVQSIKQILNEQIQQFDSLIKENDESILDLLMFITEESEQVHEAYHTDRYIYEVLVISDKGEMQLSTATPQQLTQYGYKAKQVVAEGDIAINTEKASLLFQGDQYLKESLGGEAKIKVYEKDGIAQSNLINTQGEAVQQLILEGTKGRWGHITQRITAEGIVYDLQEDKAEDNREIKIHVDFTQITPKKMREWQEKGEWPMITIHNPSKSPLFIQVVLTKDQKVNVEQLVAIKKKKEVPVIVQVGDYLNDKVSYQLILVVRDTKPSIGEAGKIVKKRLDLYTP